MCGIRWTPRTSEKRPKQRNPRQKAGVSCKSRKQRRSRLCVFVTLRVRCHRHKTSVFACLLPTERVACYAVWHPRTSEKRPKMTRSTNRFRFSQKSLAALKPTDRDQLFYDDGCPGLGVRISPKGRQTFFARIGSRRRSLKSKRLENARAEVRAIQNVSDAVESTDWTLQATFDYWMEHKAKPHKRTWQRDQSRFDRYLRPWGKRSLSSLQQMEIMQLHNSIREESGPYAANDTLAFLSSLFRYAERFGFRGVNPCRFIDRFPEQERERYLLPEEFPRWYAAVQELRVSESRDFLLLALWTGVRREAVLSMRWEDVDLSAKMWRIPAESDKGKRTVLIYLSDVACEILQRRFDANDGSPWVLPSRNGSASGHYADPKSAWNRVLELSGISDLRIHDLRRTLGSWMAEGGTSLPIIGKTLGHKSLQATRIYARLGGNAVRDAVNAATEAMRNTLPDP